MSVEEYLAFEMASSTRHEYVDGEIYAMSGASVRHSQIAMNIAARAWNIARGERCRVHRGEVKLRIDSIFYYPDVMVACGTRSGDSYIEDAPCLLVEVLSPSTESTDRREKLMVYRGIASLGAYLIVDQDRRLVEHYRRDVDGGWRHVTFEQQGDIALPCPTVFTLTLDEIYEAVELPPLEEVLRVREEADAIYR
jgi:Uma2 family endonuclease